MKPKLLIISDLFGFENSGWVNSYTELLEVDFELVLYDCCSLAGIDKIDMSKGELHSQFLDGGIETAVNKLLNLEKKEINVLAFSIGGTIAWKAALKGLAINHLFAISSTRLRFETKKPSCSIHLVLGENDPFIPAENWFHNLNLKSQIIKNGTHEIYRQKEIIRNLCKRIKTVK